MSTGSMGGQQGGGYGGYGGSGFQPRSMMSGGFGWGGPQMPPWLQGGQQGGQGTGFNPWSFLRPPGYGMGQGPGPGPGAGNALRPPGYGMGQGPGPGPNAGDVLGPRDPRMGQYQPMGGGGMGNIQPPNMMQAGGFTQASNPTTQLMIDPTTGKPYDFSGIPAPVALGQGY